MKTIAIIISILFSQSCLFAQSQNEFNYSVGLNLFTYGSVPKLFNEVRSADSFKSENFSGLVAKFNDNQISVRLLGNRFFENNYSFYNECKDCEIVKGKYTSYEFKVGFEKSILYSKLQPIFGADIGFKSVTFNGKAMALSNGNMNNNYVAQSQKDGFLLYPFVGIKYSPIHFLTFTIESGFDVYYSNEKQDKTFNDNTKTSDNKKQWEFLNQPVGLFSLQFNFGEN